MILTLPVPMYLPPSNSNQRGVGNDRMFTSLPRWIFSSTGPSRTMRGGICFRSLDAPAPFGDEFHRAQILRHAKTKTEPLGRTERIDENAITLRIAFH